MIDKQTAKEKAIFSYTDIFEKNITQQIDNAIKEAVKEGDFSITLTGKYLKYEPYIRDRYKIVGYKVKHYLGGIFEEERIKISWE